ncbi:Diguanylate cyclase (GGDEF) domain-containing protein [Blastococcus saxobsidens DD2]|uniref:Diguanylate cyclase (GGDEF) domain-containing protein n=2 Tax=Blastococcus saxobsidens TaxID=138336 RepID=H6RJT7_BLASD|nr:Diguanylate cyclase (GGDEF) domain-containing protein [Blastococcus saxobsidens DD2]
MWLIMLVCAPAIAGWAWFQPAGTATATLAAHWLGAAALLLGALACRAADPRVVDRLCLGVTAALLGVLLTCGLNLLSRDTSVAAQAFLAFPILWAASNLRAPAVALVTATALAAQCATLLHLLPPAAALTDVAFFGAVLVVMAVTLVRSNTVQERLVGALQRQVTVDSLTGLATRRAFDDALEAALTRSIAGGTALVLIDVDSFKSINDTHGHPVGDDVLVHLARIMRGRIRTDDAVLSRLGGDEIAVLLPGCDREVAARRAEELLDAVRAEPLPLPDGTLLSLSISLGVAHVPASSRDRRALYTSADGALYDAKRAGRGQVALAPV